MMLSPPPKRPLRRFFLSPQSPRAAQNGRPAQRLRPICSSLLARCRQSRSRWLLAAVALTALMGFSLPASASLGGRASSVESDRAQMNASHRVMEHDTYEVHEMQAPGGTVVDEYVSSAGTVFAVAWHGQFPPPMQQILGTYFEQYSNALQARPKNVRASSREYRGAGAGGPGRRPHAGSLWPRLRSQPASARLHCR